MPKIVTHLLAAAAATLAVLTAAPAAHAGWVTGAGNPPAFQAAPVCQNGMIFHYATFLPWGSPPVEKLAIYDLQAFAADNLGPKGPTVLLAGGNFSIPRSPFYIDPETIGGGITTWLPKRAGWFDFHAQITLRFRASPGTRIQVRWRRTPDGPWAPSWTWVVESCWLEPA